MWVAQVCLEPNWTEQPFNGSLKLNLLSSLGNFKPKTQSTTYECNHWLYFDFVSGDVDKESKALSGILFVPGVFLMFMGLVVIGTAETGLEIGRAHV